MKKEIHKKAGQIKDMVLQSSPQDRINSKISFVLLIVFYILTACVTGLLSHSDNTISIAGIPAHISSFVGVFSYISNTCIIFLTLFFKKPGFITSIILLVSQFPMVIRTMVMAHSFAMLPGVFANLFSIIVIIVIQANNKKISKYQQKMHDQALTDMMTGLPNRFAGSEYAKQLIRKKEPFTIVSVDLNNFKSINDIMGHSFGNEILKEIAARWYEAANSGDTGTDDQIVRHGGDEFLIFIRGYSSDDEVLRTIRHYESLLADKLTINECDYFITASFGYAEYPTDAKISSTLLSCADAAMYEVKHTNSSNHILRFTPDMLRSEHTVEIERKIRNALENDTLCFYLQPQYDIDHNLRGFEALARMKDAGGNFISPAEFIPVAEKVGLIDKVDVTVFRKAAAFFGELVNNTDTKITLSVNVSVRHMMKSDFTDEIREIISSSGVPAEQIEIEITESIMIESAEKALECINALKALGIKIAIDDFGTGYSSLSYLNKFPADLLKIDKSFIDKMNTSESSRQYVAAIISIGHIMNFDVISEGVEEPEQLETLKSIGCDFIQGYIWGRPMPPEEAEKLVTGITDDE